MNVYRYMSHAEFNQLITGQHLINPKRRDDSHSNAYGFCFLAETTTFTTRGYDGQQKTYEYTPEDCASFLGGIVTEDLLIEFEVIDPSLLQLGFGVYMSPITVEYDETIKISEYSCPEYDRTVLRPVRFKLAERQDYTYWPEQSWFNLAPITCS